MWLIKQPEPHKIYGVRIVLRGGSSPISLVSDCRPLPVLHGRIDRGEPHVSPKADETPAHPQQDSGESHGGGEGGRNPIEVPEIKTEDATIHGLFPIVRCARYYQTACTGPAHCKARGEW